ncbi:MAG: mechanosensitive ion channel family protein [Spirochaetaceae bacterium]|jgi:small-conductance mechanosensitive channel|nr:mechanosensitive ion channel family protein [Spirochaetaceae bacterium]
MKFRFFFIGMMFVFLQFPLPFALGQDDTADAIQEAEETAPSSQPEIPGAAGVIQETGETPPLPQSEIPGAAGAIQEAGETPPPSQPGIAAAAASTEETLLEIEEAVDKLDIVDWLEKIGIALAIIAVQALLIWVIWAILFKKITGKVLAWGKQKIKPLTIKKLKLLSTQQILNVVQFLLKILKYIITIFQFFITLPLIFSLFPATQHLASTLFGYILNPLKKIFFGAVGYIPNLITVVIILWVTKYVLRALKFFASQIERERLVINGFYADWAWPTFNILRVLVYAFTVVMIYPYLPGSGSPIFQGVSVFIGVIFSLGSSSAIGNLIAGLVITYMRPFKIGDRIQIQNNIGFVVEKTLMVVRIRTHKNEYVTYPNTMILSSGITNYNTSSAEDEEGLIIYTDVTMNYAVPWPQVHQILIDAALKTTSILKTPKPFVLQTALDDFYCRYQINAYTKEVSKVPRIYSNLFENLQTGFAEAGIDLTAPQYRINIPYEPVDKKAVKEIEKRGVRREA